MRLVAPGSIAISLDSGKIQKNEHLKNTWQKLKIGKSSRFLVVSFVYLFPELTTSFGSVRFYR